MAVVALLLAAPVYGQECPGDINRDGAVTIDEIISAIDVALNGCPERSDFHALSKLQGGTWTISIADDSLNPQYAFPDPPVTTANGTEIRGRRVQGGDLVIAYAAERPDTSPFRIDPDVILLDVFPSACVGYVLRIDGNVAAGYARYLNATCTTRLSEERVIVIGRR